jgi:hypothetical protein
MVLACGIGRFKYIARIYRILIAHQHLEAGSGPGNVGPHAADRVGLNDGVDTCALKRAFRQSSLWFATELVDDNKVSLGHASMLRPVNSMRSARLAVIVSNYRQIIER